MALLGPQNAKKNTLQSTLWGTLSQVHKITQKALFEAVSRPGPLAAQCEIPPHIAQYLFEIVSQRGVSHPFALLSCGIAQVSLRYPFWRGGGGIAPPLRMLSQGGKSQKRGRGYRTELAMLRHQKPHSAQ